MTIDEAIAFLSADGGRVPCSRYGFDSASCAPWAVACHLIYIDCNGAPDDDYASLDYYMGLVVNDHDDIADLIREHGHALVGTELAYLVDEVAAWDAEREHDEHNHDDAPNPYEHEYPASDDEWEYACPYCSIRVSAVGGGTVGRSYVGNWHYRITVNGVTRGGSDLVTGSPTTHAQAATLVSEFYDSDD